VFSDVTSWYRREVLDPSHEYVETSYGGPASQIQILWNEIKLVTMFSEACLLRSCDLLHIIYLEMYLYAWDLCLRKAAPEPPPPPLYIYQPWPIGQSPYHEGGPRSTFTVVTGNIIWIPNVGCKRERRQTVGYWQTQPSGSPDQHPMKDGPGKFPK
jgi:hypothetical protein